MPVLLSFLDTDYSRSAGLLDGFGSTFGNVSTSRPIHQSLLIQVLTSKLR